MRRDDLGRGAENNGRRGNDGPRVLYKNGVYFQVFFFFTNLERNKKILRC